MYEVVGVFGSQCQNVRVTEHRERGWDPDGLLQPADDLCKVRATITPRPTYTGEEGPV